MKEERKLKTIRWIARIWSVLSILFLLTFFVGEVLLAPGELGKMTALEMTAFAFFPLGTLLGLIIAWWKETLGGALALGSLLIFYIVLTVGSGRFPGGPWFILIAAPGIFFLLAARLQRKMT